MLRKILSVLLTLSLLLCALPALSEGGVTLSSEYIEMTKLGETAYLAVLANGEEAAHVAYTSSNDKVAAVNHGVIMAMGDGSAVITAAYEGKEYVCTVKVATDFSLAIAGDSLIGLSAGDTAQLSATVTLPTIFDTVDAVSWSTSDEAVATVDANGLVTAVGTGLCTITAESLAQRTTKTQTMMGSYISTDGVSAGVTVIVGNEYTPEAYPDLAGLYCGQYDWQGFTQDLKKDAPVWTDDQFLWIRALESLELHADGTFRQQVLNAQRKGYAYDPTLPGGTTYDAQAAKYQKGYIYNRYTQKGADFSTGDKQFHDIVGMEEDGIFNFSETGVFAVLDGQLVLLYKGQIKTLGEAAGNAWLENVYVPFNNMVAMSENMAMKLAKTGAEEAEEAASDETAQAETASDAAPAAEGETFVGTGSMTWHGDTVFTAIVDVTIQNGVLTGIVLREGSVIDTGVSTFRLWNEGKDAYLAQYAGKTVQEILDLKLTPSANQDHYDGGKIEGAIDAVSGATASSTTIAMAVQNAVQKAVTK